MRFHRRVWLELGGMGLIAGLVAFGIAYATGHHGAPPTDVAPPGPGSKLETRTGYFVVQAGLARVSLHSQDGAVSREIELSLLVDGISRPISVGVDEMRASDRDGIKAQFPVQIGDESADAQIAIQLDPANDALIIELRVKGERLSEPHAIALNAEVSSGGKILFVSGTGEIADHALLTGASLVIDDEAHPIGIVSSRGPIGISTIVDDPTDPGEQIRVSATSPPISFPAKLSGKGGGTTTDLRITIGETSQRIWRALFALAGIPTARVRGLVAGTKDRARFFGRDAQGQQQVRGLVDDHGKFEVDVPVGVVEWYAAIDASRSSALASFIPGTSRELVLDVSPGGELKVSIVDFDTKKPIVARLLVRGAAGTVDPSFGPDYRASGAGPLIDARGEVITPLPSGKYRIMATKGIEWSVDYADVDIGPGRTADIRLAPRHVVPTPGVVGCDLHVHSRPSFDSPVSVEDRVLSLVSAGIDFAVPTEHNVVGDYASAIETYDLGHEFASVTGVEITTMGGGFGHFGIFPYPKHEKPPPARNVSMGVMIKAAREGDPKRFFQVHHPRLPRGIGYFTVIGFSPKTARANLRGRFDFDGIEVFNGFDVENIPRVEEVMRDWYALLNFGYRHVATGSSDAHRIQYQWAGYPRTMVALESWTEKIDEKFDPLAVVAAIKKGHSTITSGPLIEFELGGVRPGDELPTSEDPIRGHLRVRAAPWVDVSSIQLILNGRIVQNFPVESRPTKVGREEGTIEEAHARTIRFDQDIAVNIGPDNGWVQVVVRGNRRMDDVLPFMKVPPFGFSNPIWITRRHVPPPPLILTGTPSMDGGRPPPPPAVPPTAAKPP